MKEASRTAPGVLLSSGAVDFGAVQTGAGGKRLSITFANSWRGAERIGTIPVGHYRSEILTVANRGTVPLTITRAIAPLEPFSVPAALPEGIALDPGSSVHLRIVFAPTSAGAAHGSYEIRGSDGRGPTLVALAGRGS